jgi:hypothetical protein
MTRFERRVRKLEARASGNDKTVSSEIWIVTRDGLLHGQHGEILSPQDFDRRQSRARTVVILPHNERSQTHDRARRERPARQEPQRLPLGSKPNQLDASRPPRQALA